MWTYQLFKVGGAETNYQLTIGQGQGVGSAYNAMAHSNGASFSTPDCDNDRRGRNCVVTEGGAWWHNGCTFARLNGNYRSSFPN